MMDKEKCLLCGKQNCSNHKNFKEPVKSQQNFYYCCNGAPGPTGPTGPSGVGSILSGIQVQLQLNTYSTIADGAPVLFNTILFDKTDAITYEPLNGIFTIDTPGVYYFDFSIAMDGAASSPTIAYELNGSDGTSVYIASAIVSDLLSGNALVDVKEPTTFRLLNKSGDEAYLPNLIVQANMTIIHLEH